ncbi:MAG TPA: hypothetical protein VM871_09800, partial [Flavisolibacter sp.]|nr:hypothetical protein [Flavisolibacter sp.]
ATSLKGLNVTIPYKEEIVPFLTEKNNVVEAIGACNCIKIMDNRLVGYNTDVVGFRKSLEPQLLKHHQNALILGTGGAAKAVCYALKQLGVNYHFVSRSSEEGQWTYKDLDEEVLSSHHLIINTTPLGMYPLVDAAPPVPYHFLTPAHFLFDLIYNPAETKFLTEAVKRGAQICNGHQMLVEQAEESWRIWSEED